MGHVEIVDIKLHKSFPINIMLSIRSNSYDT